MDIMHEMRVNNNMNTANLEYINILGLFNRYDVELPFDKEVNIFIGENGLGKTTILNCIYYILEKKIEKLQNIDFSEIQVKFRNDTIEYSITSSDIDRYYHQITSYPNNYIFSAYLKNAINNKNLSFEFIDYITRKIAREMEMPLPIARSQILKYLDLQASPNNPKNGDKTKVYKLIKAIEKNISQRIIYLPTYRRIENDFNDLNIRNERFNENELLIRFGMSDVKESIDEILKVISSEAMKGFTEMTGVLLKQYADGISNTELNDKIDYETVKIVLDRVGNEIEASDKNKILDLIKKDKIYNNDYLYLLNLIRKLISNYDSQKRYDDRIKSFKNTCNKYLKNKHFHYDQSMLTLKIYLDNDDGNDDETIELTQLSSGEKQIVSLFSRLYLESDEKSIVIIDEPELSLSLPWQQLLLPDIMRTKNCNLLLTVTHSPFIFENEFDDDAKDMKKYIKIHK